jgi:hypothetical protein
MCHHIAITESLKRMNLILKENKIENNSNFIIANEKHILIANVHSNDSGIKMLPLDLFIDKTSGIFVCSSKMTDSSKRMRTNSSFILQI